MGKFYLLFITFMIISCEEEDMLVPKTAAREAREVEAPSGEPIRKAKEMEAFLQKQADSIVRQFDSLGVPK